MFRQKNTAYDADDISRIKKKYFRSFFFLDILPSITFKSDNWRQRATYLISLCESMPKGCAGTQENGERPQQIGSWRNAERRRSIHVLKTLKSNIKVLFLYLLNLLSDVYLQNHGILLFCDILGTFVFFISLIITVLPIVYTFR